MVCLCSNCDLFHRTVLLKCGRDINCSLDYGWWVKNTNIPQSKPKALWWILSWNKSAPANRKTGFCANRDLNKQEVGFICVWSGSELWSLFKYSRVKLKKSKTYSGWCPSWLDGTFKSLRSLTWNIILAASILWEKVSPYFQPGSLDPNIRRISHTYIFSHWTTVHCSLPPTFVVQETKNPATGKKPF
jgi:hypothetical protein